MWQKCPNCNGSGKINQSAIKNIFNICETCNGKGIINSLTGLPPQNNTSNSTKDFRDGNMESQQEYFGNKYIMKTKIAKRIVELKNHPIFKQWAHDIKTHNGHSKEDSKIYATDNLYSQKLKQIK